MVWLTKGQLPAHMAARGAPFQSVVVQFMRADARKEVLGTCVATQGKRQR